MVFVGFLTCTFDRSPATNGVVLATEKKMPTVLIDENSLVKTTKIAEHVGMVYSGMGPDARVLLRKARKIAQQYYHVYHEPIPVQQIVREIASVMQEFTQSGYALPTECFKAAGTWRR